MSVELKKGDIIVFKAEKDFISQCIALITRSEFSHAAMIYDDDTIVELVSKGISVNKITESAVGREAKIMRRDGELNPKPLIEAANVYINAETRYDFPALVILAGLLIYRYVRPTPEFVRVADSILRMACKMLDSLIQKISKKGKTMVCSQLVYQIYLDCGKEYWITLESSDFRLNNTQNSGLIRLGDMLEDVTGSITAPDTDNKEDDPEELAGQLYTAMSEKKTNSINNERLMPDGDFRKLTEDAKRFIELLEKFLEKCGSKLPIYSLFVTPGDLANHATNLQKIKTTKIIVQH